MKYLFFFLFTASLSFVTAQSTWSGNTAQLVYNKCTTCHHPGGIGGFSLMTYAEISQQSSAIYDAIALDRMPPWPPDNTYQQYIHTRSLSASEKTTLLDWITAGLPLGNAANIPPPPVYTSDALLGTGDLTVKIPKYKSKATSTHDDYVCFSIPSGLTQNRVIKSVEIIPGNRQIVHHALIFIDPLAVEQTDTAGGCASPGNNSTKLIAGYTPGATPMTLPSTAPLKLGIDINAGSNIYFAMHYPAGSFGEYDSTKVIFHFYPVGTSGIRQITADKVIKNNTFSLPPNQLTNVSAQYPSSTAGLPYAISFLSVFPHMHLLGKKIKSYGVKPNGDTVNFINLPHWDFHWQDFYFFKHIQMLPVGSKIKGEGKYDNTSANLHNPHNPPITVTAGLNTSDEMFIVYFHYMLYQAGDENYDLEQLMSLGLEEQLQQQPGAISVFPNPTSEGTSITHSEWKAGDIVSIFIYDSQGRLIKKVTENYTLSTNDFLAHWDGTNTQGESVKKGMYFLSMTLNGKPLSRQLVKN